MSADHLPECFIYGPPSRPICICDRLRACEQRVLDEYVIDRYGPTWRAALNAAREAVAVARMHDVRDGLVAIAAIDALKGEAHD